VPKCPRHFGTIGHFGTNAKIWDTSAPCVWCRSVLGPKCLRSEASVHQSQGLVPQGQGRGLEHLGQGHSQGLHLQGNGITLHIYSVIGNGQNSKLLPLKLFVQNMQWLVKSVSSSFSKDLSHEAKDSTRKAKAKDSTLKAKAKTKDFKIVLRDENLSSKTPTLVVTCTSMRALRPCTFRCALSKRCQGDVPYMRKSTYVYIK